MHIFWKLFQGVKMTTYTIVWSFCYQFWSNYSWIFEQNWFFISIVWIRINRYWNNIINDIHVYPGLSCQQWKGVKIETELIWKLIFLFPSASLDLSFLIRLSLKFKTLSLIISNYCSLIFIWKCGKNPNNQITVSVHFSIFLKKLSLKHDWKLLIIWNPLQAEVIGCFPNALP